MGLNDQEAEERSGGRRFLWGLGAGRRVAGLGRVQAGKKVGNSHRASLLGSVAGSGHFTALPICYGVRISVDVDTCQRGVVGLVRLSSRAGAPGQTMRISSLGRGLQARRGSLALTNARTRVVFRFTLCGEFMFQGLSDRLNGIFKRLRVTGSLTEDNIGEALREVRLALLEADVNVKVVRSFLERVRERAVGRDVLESLTPGQQVVKVVYEELAALMGGEANRLRTAGQPPTVIMLVGLQGPARRPRPESWLASSGDKDSALAGRRGPAAPGGTGPAGDVGSDGTGRCVTGRRALPRPSPCAARR